MIFSNDKTKSINIKRYAIIILGTAISSFGIYNIHRQTHITEGGVLGLILLLNNWTGVSPAILTPLLDIICYAFAFRYLGWDFIKISLLSTLSLAGFFKLWEMFPPVLPNLSAYPLAAALAGGLFVGIGVGLIIGQGASSGGDDALALILSKLTHCRISHVYLATDITVLLLSLSYIPLNRIAYSLVTVTVSSLLIEQVQKLSQKTRAKTNLQFVPEE
ncbi:YitT family protein [Anaerocolumna chitinilytica]|uniref:Membrane protein n=1 Tax=Anaerocolumna chitinilytica TaxID=1727145 RepID=A0A7I8DM05_9FIRM|nr:YitT family protein [Anaerocolumna chitinilytica]BCJ98311.1 membrane protein [Anaerocolumna chitinilytica]